VRLTLYASDVPADSPVDMAIRDWLRELRPGVDPGAELRPVQRLELLAEGRVAVDAIAGMTSWSDHRWAVCYTGVCDPQPDLYPHGDRALVLRRYTFDAVPPVCALPHFHPEP
jgi:hypothetical protein